MRIARVLGIVAATAAATAAIGVTTATTVVADPLGNCSGGWVCLYENEDFNNGNTDHWRNFKENKTDFRNFTWRNAAGGDSGDNMNNETSSIRNRLGRCVTLYQSPGYTGDPSAFPSGAAYDDGKLGNNNVGDNRASSIMMAC